MCKAISLVPSPVVLHGSCFGRDVSDVKIKKNQMNIWTDLAVALWSFVWLGAMIIVALLEYLWLHGSSPARTVPTWRLSHIEWQQL